jgi:acyl carrier protein phosphodiesterase
VNYLAHAYLSFGIPEILVGNLISDFVKGKKKFDYPSRIQEGIGLHRSIDEFTDSHPATAKAKEFFRGDYGLYSGAFIDIVYDHFLANDSAEFSKEDSLGQFAAKTYDQLTPYTHVFPEKFARIFHYMKSQNWLLNYRLKEGIHNSFAGLVHRAAFLDDPRPAVALFDLHYDQLKDCYDGFFPEVKAFTLRSLGN